MDGECTVDGKPLDEYLADQTAAQSEQHKEILMDGLIRPAPKKIFVMTKQEGNFIAQLGVYAIWLLRYGKTFTRTTINNVRHRYKQYLEADDANKNATAMRLFYSIDIFCARQNHPRPGDDYETALKEFLAWRTSEYAREAAIIKNAKNKKKKLARR